VKALAFPATKCRSHFGRWIILKLEAFVRFLLTIVRHGFGTVVACLRRRRHSHAGDGQISCSSSASERCERAALIVINKGITAKRVTNPRMTKMPHVTSKAPTKGARNSGFGSPIFWKRPNSKFSRIEEFLNTFGQKNGSNHQSNNQRRDMPTSLDDLLKHKFLHSPFGEGPLGYCRRKTKPATPDRRTSNQAGHFQNCSKPNAARAMINATDESTANVQTGL
jgi:hypothetical protein